MSVKRILYGVVLGSTLLALIFLFIFTLQLESNLEQNTRVLNERVVGLENYILALEQELENHKEVTRIHFESNWRSIARMNNNFKALGKGFILEEKDVAPNTEFGEEDAYARMEQWIDDFYKVRKRK